MAAARLALVAGRSSTLTVVLVAPVARAGAAARAVRVLEPTSAIRAVPEATAALASGALAVRAA
jgi:hypothetical protein